MKKLVVINKYLICLKKSFRFSQWIHWRDVIKMLDLFSWKHICRVGGGDLFQKIWHSSGNKLCNTSCQFIFTIL